MLYVYNRHRQNTSVRFAAICSSRADRFFRHLPEKKVTDAQSNGLKGFQPPDESQDVSWNRCYWRNSWRLVFVQGKTVERMTPTPAEIPARPRFLSGTAIVRGPTSNPVPGVGLA